MENYIVMTSINSFTEAVMKMTRLQDWRVVFVGDEKTPNLSNFKNVNFFSLGAQYKSNFSLARLLPLNHYSRKNVGYLHAAASGAEIIYDTDDDNIPYDSALDMMRDLSLVKWGQRDELVRHTTTKKERFLNGYRYFTDQEKIWPRGFPLDEINSEKPEIITSSGLGYDIGVRQFLVDNDPDVDAIHRLVFGVDDNFFFRKERGLVLDKGEWCPFNSQSTLWKRKFFPLMYLPITVTFRFTDILRSYVAQACLWAAGSNLCFESSIAFQERNVHDLIEDFKSEEPCFLYVRDIANILSGLDLCGNPSEDILRAYKKLVEIDIVEEKELSVLDSWLKDLTKNEGQS